MFNRQFTQFARIPVEFVACLHILVMNIVVFVIKCMVIVVFANKM